MERKRNGISNKKQFIKQQEALADVNGYIEEYVSGQKVIKAFNKEEDVKKKYPKVNFRWSEFEIARAKKIAKKLGMPYQTYIKSLLKQGMDKDEKFLKEM